MFDKFLDDINNKNLEKIMVTAMYLTFFFLVIFITKVGIWSRYNDNTHMTERVKKASVSYDNIINYDSNRTYYRKIKVTKIIRAEGFPNVEVIKIKEDLGIWSVEK